MKTLELNQMEKVEAGGDVHCQHAGGWAMASIFSATAGFIAVGVLTGGVGLIAGAAYLTSVSVSTAGVASACS